jgi:hypothetical protein
MDKAGIKNAARCVFCKERGIKKIETLLGNVSIVKLG